MDVSDRDSSATGDADGGRAPAGEPIRIVLADDHAVVRSGLRMLLDGEQDFEVVAEASDVEKREALHAAPAPPRGCSCWTSTCRTARA